MTKFTNFFKAIVCITCFTVQINSISAQVSWPPPGGINGNGTDQEPWEITTIAQLIGLANYVNAGNGSLTAGVYYKLMNDIDYNLAYNSSKGWAPIGNNEIDDAIFQGIFNGNGQKVSNIWIDRDATPCIGLFGYVSSAHIHDLGIEIEDSQAIRGNQYVGGLIGKADNSIIENCYATGNVIGNYAIGGLVGVSSYSTISNSYALCEVSGFDIGGLVGINGGTIITSYAGGHVTATGNHTGGFVGTNNHTIIDCYAVGDVSGTSYIGGFAGVNKEGNLIYCYAAGDITATGDFVGGLVGENEGTLINCVAANSTVAGGVSNVNRIAGENTGILSQNYAYEDMVINQNGGNAGMNATMADLMSFNFYNTGGNWFNNSWSIDTDDNPLKSWKICDGETLPFLQWEGIECPYIDPCDEPHAGTIDDPYLICTAEQLAALSTFVNNGNGAQTANKYYKLMNDLNLIDYSAGNGWAPIGNYSSNSSSTAFQGNFNGNYKVISNLIIDRGSEYYIGLFGRTLNASIRNIGIESSEIDGGQYIGSLIGYVSGTSIIENCYAINNSTSVISHSGVAYGIGGLIGWDNGNSTYTNCYAGGTLTGTAVAVGYVYGLAGLIGWCTGASSINNCYAIGTLTGTATGTGSVFGIGGLVGYSYATDISNSYAICNINGDQGIGGLVGSNFSGAISGCYTEGNVFAIKDAGGLTGLNFDFGAISNCYSIANVSGTGATIGGLVGLNIGNITYCYATGTINGVSYIGGLAGICSEGALRNCVAANDNVYGTILLSINRIAGSLQNNPVLSHNYAYDNMVITTNGGDAGISTPMSTLMSFNFYDTGSNWFSSTPWDIDLTPNPNKIWGICDSETLPFFQWQGLNCSKKMPQTVNYEDDYPSEPNRMSKFSIYPNPTSGNITISSERDFHTIEIVDLLGRVIYVQPNNGNNITLNISGYSNGIYFVRIITENGKEMQKFVKN
jgi:hypothetical protein